MGSELRLAVGGLERMGLTAVARFGKKMVEAVALLLVGMLAQMAANQVLEHTYWEAEQLMGVRCMAKHHEELEVA